MTPCSGKPQPPKLTYVTHARAHGWPSFRDQEVVWDNVRCLANGEAVSVDGTHLGHNLPDKKGNRCALAATSEEIVVVQAFLRILLYIEVHSAALFGTSSEHRWHP
jgi:hypothetical protein